MSEATRVEPPPIRNAERPVWDCVVEDLVALDNHRGGAAYAAVISDARQRDAFGRAKYGTPLQAHNGRDALVDAYQEFLDACVYLKQSLLERHDGVVHAYYRDALNAAVGIHDVIRRRVAEGAAQRG